MVENETFSYLIETDIPSNYTVNLMDFIYRKYIQPQENVFADVSRGSADGVPSLYFTILNATGKHSLEVEVKGTTPLRLKMIKLSDRISPEFMNTVKQDITIIVDFFEENVRMSTLYFAWREGEEIVPERLCGKENRSLNRIFLETQILFFLLFIVLSVFLFQVIGLLTPIVLLAVQLVFVLYSNKLIARTADWRITESNPTIHLLEYHLPLEEHDTYRQMISKDKLIELKKEVYEQTISKKGEIDCATVHQIFNNSGLECRQESLTTKKIDVYQLVKKVADKFSFPMPEVVVSNTALPNAAASGPGPSHGVVLITTGALVQLDEDEIVSVLGHEFGHLRGRDPLFLYGLTAIQYLFLFYLVYPFIAFSIFTFFLYFWVVMTALYFVAKFFEARADLFSAIVVGQPEVLAKALEKIGFKRLLNERVPAFRIQEWVSFDPHPPIYFRVDRLEKIKPPVTIKHPLIQSAKDVTHGFLASF